MRTPSCRTILLVLILLPACHMRGKGTSSNSWPGVSDSLAARLLGSYSGQFRSGLLTLVINYVGGNTISGYDLHKGLRRNVNGRIEEKNGQYAIVLKEPGTSPSDGTFYLSLKGDAAAMTGYWVPADSTKLNPGLLNLKRSASSAEDSDAGYDIDWVGEQGSLMFKADGSCTLAYYPKIKSGDSASVDSNAQLITIRGNYQKQAHTFRIEWQNNSHTPSLRMKLVWKHAIEHADLVVPDILHGNGVEFEINVVN